MRAFALLIRISRSVFALSLRPRLLLTKAGRYLLRPRSRTSVRKWVRNSFRKWCVDEDQIVYTPWEFQVAVSPRDYASFGIYFFDDYDPVMSRVLSCLVREGQTAWDVGAERGWFTLLLARLVGSSGRVDSFEAYLPNYNKLISNVERNGMTWVNVVHRGVGDGETTKWFVPPSDEITNHVGFLQYCSGVGYLTDRPEPNAVRVETISLDEYANLTQLESLSFIKLDIEGAEYDALRGAERVIRRYRPIIVVEYNHGTAARSGTSLEELDNLLDEFGYDRYTFSNRFIRFRLEDRRERDNTGSVWNIYCIPRGTMTQG